MKMFDRWLWTLKDMRHVSGLRKKSFLVGALKAQGYKFSDTDGALKVTKGSMTVLKVERMTNLYKVIESVVIGDTFEATKKDDSTRL